MSSRILTKYNLLRTKVLHSIGYLKFVIKSYEVGVNGRCIPAMIFDVGQTVGFLVFNTDTQKFTLVSQTRFATFERHVNPRFLELEILSERINPGEDPVNVVLRECQRITGYHPKKDNISQIGSFDISPAYLTERMMIYFVEISNGDKRGDKTSDDEIKIVEVKPDQISDLRYENLPITDMKTSLSIQWWLLNHKVAKMLP